MALRWQVLDDGSLQVWDDGSDGTESGGEQQGEQSQSTDQQGEKQS
ncbi:hypothetical protein SALCHL_006578 (plasmid) [Streptomyces albus subsp. chlorinus]|nr:hypothetical protein [Streptomyces albus]